MKYQVGKYYRRGNTGFVFKVLAQYGTHLLVEIVGGSESIIEHFTHPSTSTLGIFKPLKVIGDKMNIWHHDDDVEITEEEVTFEVI